MIIPNPFKIIRIQCRECNCSFISSIDYIWCPGWRLEKAYYNCPKCDHYDEAEYYLTIEEDAGDVSSILRGYYASVSKV